jgi:hypothetical protein
MLGQLGRGVDLAQSPSGHGQAGHHHRPFAGVGRGSGGIGGRQCRSVHGQSVAAVAVAR